MNYKQENIMQCNYRQNKEKGGGGHSWILPKWYFSSYILLVEGRGSDE